MTFDPSEAIMDDLADAWPPFEPPAEDEEWFAQEVRRRAQRERVNRAAKALVDAESQPPPKPIDLATLGEVLERPAPPQDRIEGLAPWEGNHLITAPRKAGKTTLVGNLARCLITGERFLASFPVTPLTGRLAILNFEVSAGMLARWLDDLGVDPDRVLLANLRGTANPFRYPNIRADLAAQLRGSGVEAVIVDTFGRAYTGDNQNDIGAVTSFLDDLEIFTRDEVGARDLFLTNHAGWEGERSRGASSLEDWPDSCWRITRGQGDDEGTRYFSAFGRDVDVDEDALSFDHTSRRLALTGSGSRKEASNAHRDAKTESDILRVLRECPDGLSGTQLSKALGDRKGVAAVRDDLVASGRLTERPRSGRGGGMVYALTQNTPTTQTCGSYGNPPPSTPSEPMEPPPYRRGF